MNYNITYRQKDKGWQFIISYKDETGKWKQKSRQGFKTKKEAKPEADKALLELKKDISKRKYIINDDYRSITLEQLFDLFIAHSSLYKQPNTITNFKSLKKTYKSLWNMKIIDLKKIHFQDVVDNLIKENYKYGTIEFKATRIKTVLKYYIDNYDTSYTIPFKTLTLPSKENPLKNALTKSQLDDTLCKIKNNASPEVYISCLLAAYCGLRFGETIGLTWDEVDYNNMILNINKQWKFIDSNRNEGFGKLKTPNSKRKVPFSNFVKKELKAYSKLTVIADFKNRVLPIKLTTFKSEMEREMRKNSNVSIHELRHTYTTLLVENNVDFKTIAKFIGDDVQQVLKTYSHVNDDMIKNATDKIAKIF